MKTFNLLIIVALMGSNGLFKAASPLCESQRDKTPATISFSTFDTIPVPIRMSFEQKYPKASKVIWYRYTPDKTMIEPDQWYSTLDNNDYYVTFNWDDADYVAWYDDGKWIRASKRIDNIDVPAGVMRAINTQYPGYRITDVDLEYDSKQTLYEVKMVKGDSRMNVHYTPAGVVFKKKERHMNKADAQNDLTQDFTSRFPGASDIAWYHYTPDDRVEVLPTDWDYTMDPTDYEVRFKWQGSDYSAWYNDGKWVRSEVVMADGSRLPAAINNILKSQYSGYTISNVLGDQDNDLAYYDVVMTKGNEKCKLSFKQDGTMIKKKCKSTMQFLIKKNEPIRAHFSF